MMRDLLQEYNNTDQILEIICDKDTRLILESTRDFAKSANQIILECNLAQSTTYRKLKKLVQLNLLSVKYVIGKYPSREMRYRSNLCLFRGNPLFQSKISDTYSGR
jgi:DNA-binding HxlR family transcriptional regulator